MALSIKSFANLMAIAFSATLLGCLGVRPPQTSTSPTAGARLLAGSVSYETGIRSPQATLAEVANAATVSLIDATSGNTVTSSITDAAGSFVLTFPTFTPQAGVPYVLEAVKGLAVGGTSNRAGTAAVRLRSLLFWNNGWQSLTNTTLNTGIVVSTATTAIATIASLKKQAGTPVTLANLVGKVNGGSFSEAGTGLSNVNDFTPVFSLVSNAITLDQDPLRTIAFDKAKGVYTLATGVPFISSYAPKVPLPGGAVTVTGSNLDQLTGRNVFYFGDIAASTWSVSANRTTATVAVPSNAFSAPFILQQPNGVYQTIHPFLKLKGTVGTFAGSGTPGWWDNVGSKAQFYGVDSMVVTADETVYALDTANNRIRKISPSGVVTTIAGDGTAGFADGIGTAAKLFNPSQLMMDSANNIYFTDRAHQRIRKLAPNLQVTTIAGSGSAVFGDGIGTAAGFVDPVGLALDDVGNLYVADNAGHRIRKITPAGVVTTIAGNGTPASLDGTGTGAQLYNPYGIVYNNGNLYVAEYVGTKIRKIVLATGVVTTIAGNAGSGFADGPAGSAMFAGPCGIKMDPLGNLYVVDLHNYRIRMITPGGVVSTVAGSGGTGMTNGSLLTATFGYPIGMFLDGDGNIWVGDRGNNVIRVITP